MPQANEGNGAKQTATRRSPWLIALALAGVAALALSIFLPSLGRAREPAKRAMCANNLRSIGFAIKTYAEHHNGRFPARLDELMECDMVTSCFICPSTADTPAGPNEPIARGTPSKPGTCSYIYIGKVWTEKTAGESTILAYEPLENHQGDGANVLFGDIHVQWFSADELRQLLKSAGRPATTQNAP